MGNNPFCDFCRKTVPVQTALQPVKVGDDLVGEACLTCGSAVRTNLKKVIADADAQMRAAAAQTAAAQAAAIPPPAPAPAAPAAPAGMPPPKKVS